MRYVILNVPWETLINYVYDSYCISKSCFTYTVRFVRFCVRAYVCLCVYMRLITDKIKKYNLKEYYRRREATSIHDEWPIIFAFRLGVKGWKSWKGRAGEERWFFSDTETVISAKSNTLEYLMYQHGRSVFFDVVYLWREFLRSLYICIKDTSRTWYLVFVSYFSLRTPAPTVCMCARVS